MSLKYCSPEDAFKFVLKESLINKGLYTVFLTRTGKKAKDIAEKFVSFLTNKIIEPPISFRATIADIVLDNQSAIEFQLINLDRICGRRLDILVIVDSLNEQEREEIVRPFLSTRKNIKLTKQLISAGLATHEELVDLEPKLILIDP